MRVSSIQTSSPKTLDDALEILAQNHAQIHILSGGTDLIVRMQDGIVQPRFLLNISLIRELKEISIEDNWLTLGANVTFGDILENHLFQEVAQPLYQAARIMGSPQIRNMATVGGNIANASPAADSVPPLCALDAEICLENTNGIRWVRIENFATGPGKTIRKPTELLTKIRFPIQPRQWRGGFLRLGQREALAISKVSLAFWGNFAEGTVHAIRLALGAVAPTVVCAPKTQRFLTGKKITATLLDQAAEIIKTEVHPISDIRSDANYRQEMCGVLLRRALSQFSV